MINHDEEHGMIKATLQDIKDSQIRVEKTMGRFIDATQQIRIQCHQRMTSNENVISYIAARRKDRTAFVTALIALGSGIAAIWASFFK